MLIKWHSLVQEKTPAVVKSVKAMLDDISQGKKNNYANEAFVCFICLPQTQRLPHKTIFTWQFLQNFYFLIPNAHYVPDNLVKKIVILPIMSISSTWTKSFLNIFLYILFPVKPLDWVIIHLVGFPTENLSASYPASPITPNFLVLNQSPFKHVSSALTPYSSKIL